MVFTSSQCAGSNLMISIFRLAAAGAWFTSLSCACKVYHLQFWFLHGFWFCGRCTTFFARFGCATVTTASYSFTLREIRNQVDDQIITFNDKFTGVHLPG